MHRISICLFFISCYLNASEYTSRILPIDLADSECHIQSINDHGVILLSYKDRTYYSKIYLFDSVRGTNIIESKGESIHPIVINNLGQILGNSYKTFIWSNALGIRYLDIFDSDYNKGIDLNDWGQIIGEYRPKNSADNNSRRPFLWDNGYTTDMGAGSEFCKQFETLGYHVMDIKLTSINNNGEITGYFVYGKFNEKKKKYVAMGEKIFFWDGDTHILPLSIRNICLSQIKANNKGLVLVGTDESTYLWDRENDLKLIPDFFGISLNDATVILGRQVKRDIESRAAIWKDGTIISLAELLGVNDVEKISPLYSETYELERLTDFTCINNKDQIGCTGLIWNEQYPCVLEPLVDASAHLPIVLPQ